MNSLLTSHFKTGFFVILNEVKDLNVRKYEILRFAQNDNSLWGQVLK